MELDTDKLWHVVGVILLLVAAFSTIVYLSKEKKVDGYYLSRGGGSNANVCVYAHWTWHLGELVFCTDDYQKALDFVKQANSTIK